MRPVPARRPQPHPWMDGSLDHSCDPAALQAQSPTHEAPGRSDSPHRLEAGVRHRLPSVRRCRAEPAAMADIGVPKASDEAMRSLAQILAPLVLPAQLLGETSRFVAERL